jgi:hypothetical protein
MHVTLTKEQYRLLLTLAHIGEWVINADRRDEGEKEEYLDVLAHLSEAAPDFGAQEYVEQNPEDGRWYPSRVIEEMAAPFIADYDNHTFWEELTFRLAERDAVRKRGERALDLLDEEERARLLAPLREQYFAEFHAHGVDNITIVNRNLN